MQKQIKILYHVFLVNLLLLVFVVGSVFLFDHYNVYVHKTENKKIQLKNLSLLYSRALQNQISEAKHDSLFLSSTVSSISGTNKAPLSNTKIRANITRVFQSFLIEKGQYNSASFIHIQKNENESLNVNTGKVDISEEIHENFDLIFKNLSTRTKSSMSPVFIGQIEKTRVENNSTIDHEMSFASPLLQGSDLVGILILDLNVNFIIKQVTSDQEKGHYISIFDEYFENIYHTKHGFKGHFRHDSTLRKHLFSQTSRPISPEDFIFFEFEDLDQIGVFHEVLLSSSDPSRFFGVSVFGDSSGIFEGSANLDLAFVLIAIFLGSIIAMLYIEKILSPLNSITQFTHAYPQNIKTELLPTHINNEFGELSRSLVNMDRKITESQKRLKHEEGYSKDILDNAIDPIITIDSRQRIRTVNPSAISLTGYSKAELIGASLTVILPFDYRKNHQQYIDNYQSTGVKKMIGLNREVSVQNKSGELIPIRLSVSSMKDHEENEFFIGVMLDLRVKRDLEAQLEEERAKSLHSAKLASLGEMAAGVAHEINNPLAVIKGCTEYIQKMTLGKKKYRPEVQKEFLENSISQINRISKIVSGLTEFSRESSQEPFELNPISKVIDNTLILCQEKIKSRGIDLKINQDNTDLKVPSQAISLSQVLLNLINNAGDAIQNQEEKWIKLDIIEHEDFVEIDCTDSGPGISEELAYKIMNPFFTTKAVGEGTGLGLSISVGIVKKHGGDLFLDSESQNTKFVLKLPKSSAS